MSSADMVIQSSWLLTMDHNLHLLTFRFRKAFSSFLKERGITHIRSSVYYPAANGAIERFNRVLKSCVQTTMLQNKAWKKATAYFLQVYRATPHAMTGASPFGLMHGCKMRTKLNVLSPPAMTGRDAWQGVPSPKAHEGVL